MKPFHPGHSPHGQVPLAPPPQWTARSTQEAELVRLTRQYTPLVGTARNALNLLAGLRTGSPVTLYDQDKEFSFTPPTTPIGWSTVQRILNLTHSGLTSLGVYQPQPKQVAIALMGGTLAVSGGLVKIPGVLRLHCAGVPWTRIAHAFAQIAGTAIPIPEPEPAGES